MANPNVPPVMLTSDEQTLISNALELKWQSIKRAKNAAASNPKLIAVYEEDMNAINALMRNLNNRSLPL